VGREKDVFSGGQGIDLFALIDGNVKQSKNDNPGTAESIDKIASQVTLQNYINEVHKYETLLNPINEIMSNTMARAGGAEGGWGKIAADIDAAARGLDIVRDPEPPPPPKPISKPFQEIIRKNREMGNLSMHDVGDRALVLASPSQSIGSTNSPQKSVQNGTFDLRSNPLKTLMKERENRDKMKKERGGTADGTRSVRSGMDASSSLGGSREDGDDDDDTSTLDDSVDYASTDYQGTLGKTGAKARWARRLAQETAERDEMLSPVERQLGAKRSARRKRKTAIPWALLDKLEGEKRRFEAEAKYLERSSVR
jgi:hypothetical protein